MSLSANLIEYSADQFCHQCESIFSQPDSFGRLAESESFAHYDLEEVRSSYEHGCPFYAFIAQDGWRIEAMKSRGDRNVVLDSASRAFSGGPIDLEPGHIDYLRVWDKGKTRRLHMADFLNSSTPIGTLHSDGAIRSATEAG